MRTKETARTVVLTVVALAGGAWIGYADSRSDDVFITLALLMGFSFVLGLDGPRRAWLWPLLVALWVPALDVIMPRLGLAPQRPGEHFGVLSALAVTGLVMAVCFAGAYLGAMLAWAVSRLAGWPRAAEEHRS